MLTSEFSKGESYVSTPQAEPTPLFGELRASEPVPWDALGRLAEVVRAISTLTQAPEAIAMQSVLIVVSLATQAHADAEFLVGSVPLSCFALTVAQSGERKSACDHLASTAIERIDLERGRKYRLEKREFEAAKLAFQKGNRRKSNDDFDVVDDDHTELDADLPPEPPIYPASRISDPTIEGLIRQLEIGWPSVAVMTDEGGQFFGGHSMKKENALKTAAGFSKLWDGATLTKSRASAEPIQLSGKRVSLHLMIQPGVAQSVVGDPIMKDQGLLSRVLIAWPESKIGSRVIRKSEARSAEETEAKSVLAAFDKRITELLNADLPIHPGTRADLQPRVLALSEMARKQLEDFYNRVEEASGKGRAFEYMTGFAAKSPEMAVRIAGIQTIFADENAAEVTAEAMENGIGMMEWYLSEMLRITDTGRPDKELCAAEELRSWVCEKWHEDFIDKRTMMKYGPGHLRDGNTLTRCIQILEEHGWLVREAGKQVIGGAISRTYWRVVRSGTTK
ncbi:DUF3987 domain-containing protein [Ruegeria sediminis]|uniref:DUF3987 domain-containing protein n=1 Tax=Ruegeria sediminis TaxID=2583820 RepID=A0ABY2WZ21_9RHOB|nr:YfjI family protein [Ruegeria sediminis]TMV07773.1 DUF3987 domain-containing protein [Ruegeria sediminis]